MKRDLFIAFTGYQEDTELEQLLKDALSPLGIDFVAREYTSNRTVTRMSFDLKRRIHDSR